MIERRERKESSQGKEQDTLLGSQRIKTTRAQRYRTRKEKTMSTDRNVLDTAALLGKMQVAPISGAAVTDNNSTKSTTKDWRETQYDKIRAHFERKSARCAACGKSGDALKKCVACHSAWYCNVSCQKAHRKDHKRECKYAEKVLQATVFKTGNENIKPEVIDAEQEISRITSTFPPRPDCDICMLRLPPPKIGSSYMPCCGKTLCSGCIFVHNRINEDEEHWPKCPFCRAPGCGTGEEYLARVKKRAALDDVEALKKLAHYHCNGKYGVPVDAAKAIELFRQTAERGNAHSYLMLGSIYNTGDLGLDRDMAQAVKYYEMGANLGDPYCHCELGKIESVHDASIRHFQIAAETGLNLGVDMLIKCHQMGLLEKANLEKSIRAKYEAWAEMQSEERDRFIRFLKETGKYNKNDW